MNDDEHRAGAKSAAVDRCYRAPGLTNWVQPHPGAGRSGRLSVCTRVPDGHKGEGPAKPRNDRFSRVEEDN